MQKRLNLAKINAAITEKGLTQTAIAQQLDVSKEAVSQWLNEKSFPRPNKLLQLAKLLGMSFEQLIIKADPNTPRVAFRKAKGTKTKSHHIEKAQQMGCFLRHLVPYLPFDTLEMPPVLKAPTIDHDYLCKVTNKVRADINLSETDTVDFNHLIRRFKVLQTVIVPVLWGDKKCHENAIHIYLPDSDTTWVYLNLDVNIHDFKFWMAHELGHCLSPSLLDEPAEDFADAFAAYLLFPQQKAEQAYHKMTLKVDVNERLQYLIDLAKQEVVSPDTIQRQINKYAQHNGHPAIDFGKTLYGWITNFNKDHKNLSEALLGDINNLTAREYIHKTQEIFETPFFEVLGNYLKTNHKGPGIVHALTDMPLLDTRGIYAELI